MLRSVMNPNPNLDPLTDLKASTAMPSPTMSSIPLSPSSGSSSSGGGLSSLPIFVVEEPEMRIAEIEVQKCVAVEEAQEVRAD